MEDIDKVRLGHLILDGTPGEDTDPEEDLPFGRVDVSQADRCCAAPGYAVG